MSRIIKTGLLIIADIISLTLAYLGALALRFDGAIPPEHFHDCLLFLPGAILLSLAVFYLFGFYRRVWRHASIGDLYAILYGVTVSSLLVISFAYLVAYPTGMTNTLPRSLFILAWMLNLIFIGGSRFSLRTANHFTLPAMRAKAQATAAEQAGKKKALIYGAGDAGAVVVRELRNHPSLGLEPVGFIDDDPLKKGLYLLGVPILGSGCDLKELAAERNVEEIIIAMPSAPGREIREIIALCKETGARLKTLPGVYELIDGKVTASQLRDVQLEDLLGREPVQVDLAGISAYIKGKTVLVTGAGGSIGSELCRQVARYLPKRLIPVDKSENNLFEIERELKDFYQDIDISAHLVDVRDCTKMHEIFQASRPDVVFHAAAYKHVPMMERYPELAVHNNIWGTYVTALEAQKARSQVFIFVSTDKAVNPRSVMGASKRAAELVIQQLNERSKRRNLPTRFAAVRFGNVLGSRGSVVPIFKQQIKRGGPLTVTHPEMLRYFMTIPEAVQLIIQAGAMAQGGEVFVLDMGEPMKIVDLARELIRLSGLEPEKDIEIKFTGIRPGEKLKEELFTSQEEQSATKNSRIFIAHNGGDIQKTAHFLQELIGSYGRKKSHEALELLTWLIPSLKEGRESLHERAALLEAETAAESSYAAAKSPFALQQKSGLIP